MRRGASRFGARLLEVLTRRRQFAALNERIDGLAGELHRVIDILQLLYDDEPGNRRRLAELRQKPDYARAFVEPEPLVSVVIPTYTNWEQLRDRAIPSVLAQTYQNFEIVVVGDAAPPRTEQAIAEIADERIVYENLTIRGPYPTNDYDRWNVSGVPPFNAGLQRARGLWIAPFADDDALRPTALESMIGVVQRERYELCYGKLNCILADGREVELGAFPPAHGVVGLQGSDFHGDLRFFGQELADALFGQPNDWSMIRRMMRAGVRIGFLPKVVCDYYPTSNPRYVFDPELNMRRHAAVQADKIDA